jgi:hypothetical protein
MHMKELFWKRPNVLKFKELFESENVWIVKNLSIFANVLIKETVRCINDNYFLSLYHIYFRYIMINKN